MRTFVVPDLHGRVELARGLLHNAGILSDGVRVRDPDVQVVQLGDLANCVAADADADAAILKAAPEWFDVLLLGNHEYPYFGGPRFSGFAWTEEVAGLVTGLGWQAALAVGDTLLTHAGVTPYLSAFAPVPADAATAAAFLNRAWEARWADHPWLASIGAARGGSAVYGGILWSDFNAEPRDDRWNQVHGHTPVAGGPVIRHARGATGVGVESRPLAGNGAWVVNLDCGGHGSVRRIAGLWLDDAGEFGDYVEYVGS